MNRAHGWLIHFCSLCTLLISMLSHIQTKWNQLSPASFWLAVHPFSPERSFVLHTFHLWKFCILHIFLIKTQQNEISHKNGKSRFVYIEMLFAVSTCRLALQICPSNLLPFFYAPSRESALDSCQPSNLSFAASPHVPFHQFSTLSCSPLQFSRQ